MRQLFEKIHSAYHSAIQQLANTYTFPSLQPLLTPEAMGKVESQATSGYIAVKSTDQLRLH